MNSKDSAERRSGMRHVRYSYSSVSEWMIIVQLELIILDSAVPEMYLDIENSNYLVSNINRSDFINGKASFSMKTQ